MPFGLKNASATYQRVMNAIFHDLICKSIKVYIDNVVVKSKYFEWHLADLEQVFIRMRLDNLKMNPAKCAFKFSTGNYLGFLVHHQGIEVDNNKGKAISEVRPPPKKKEL